MTSPTWITDRAPSDLDVDVRGFIQIPNPSGAGRGMRIPLENYRDGQPWRHTHSPRAWCQKVRQEKDQAPDYSAAEFWETRRFVSITRTVDGGDHFIDAIDDSGIAWWRLGHESCWRMHDSLPERPINNNQVA